jgi:signal transduction histidine kinase
VVFNEVTTIFEGRDGWVYAGRREKGLIRINKNTTDGSFEFVTNRIKNICYLAQQSADVLLIGAAYGLYKYNIKTKKIVEVRGLEDKLIRSVYCPKPYDKIWVTTYGDGIFLVVNDRLTQFPLDKEKYLATAHCIIEDDSGFFWITTNKGLFQASKQDLIDYASEKLSNVYYAYYSRENGFNSNEFNGGCQPCAVRLANGTISLPSMNGLVFFNPKEILSNPNNSKIFIDELKVDETEVPVTETLKLPHTFVLLKAYISSPYLQNRKNVQMQYALSDDSGKALWFPVNEEGIISISNLRTGRYVLRVRKSTGFGARSYAFKTLSVIVLPAWYETWLARFVFLLCFATLIYIFVKWRSQNLIRQNKILESRIDAKTDALKVTLENLQTAQNNLLRQIFLYERLVGSISHDIRTPLMFLNRSSEYLFNQLESAGDKNPALINVGKKNWEFSGRLLNLTDNLLEFIKSWLKKDKKESESINLFELIQEKIEIFLPIAQDKNTIISNNVDSNLIVKSQLGMISVIFYNLLDNALKATKNGNIVISDAMVNNKLHISVRDSGSGMDPVIVDWVNSFIPGSEKGYANTTHPAHSGIGLVITIELASLINVNLFAESNETWGTTMLMIFPEPDA